MPQERLIAPEDLIGLPSREFIFWLAKENPQIAQFSLTLYKRRAPNPSNFQEKIDTPKDELVVVEKNQLLRDKIENLLFYGYERDLSLALNSNILLQDGKIGQIPMADFNCEINNQNSNLIKKLMKEINLPGFLIVSGNSYHTLSKKLFINDNHKWEQFLGKCLLSNLADNRHIGHSLDRGYASLRISHSEKGAEPRIVDVIL